MDPENVQAKFEVCSFTRSWDNNTVYRYFKFTLYAHLWFVPCDAGISRDHAGPPRPSYWNKAYL